MKNPNEVLFAGRVLDGRDEQHPKVTLKDETVVIVRVCTVPARSHIAILDLFHEGKEADLIQRCVEQCVSEVAGERKWEPVGAVFVDNLSIESHLLLTQVCEELNFKLAITTAERMIARGQELRPIMEKIAKPIMATMRQELDSWTLSLMHRLSSVAPAKKP